MLKNLPTNAEDEGSIPGLGRSPGEGNGNPLQYSCLENPMNRRAWWFPVHGVTESQTQLSSHTYQTSCPFAHKGDGGNPRLFLFVCLLAFLFVLVLEELFELNEEPLRTPSSHFTDEKAEAQRGTVTWPKAHSERGGSILCQPSKAGAAFPRIPSPSWLWVGGSHGEICMRSGGWKCNSSHYCNSACVRSQAMLQPPHLLAHLAALGHPARPVQIRLHQISSFSFPELWARFVCNVMMKPASSADHPYHPLEGWRQQEITQVPVTDRCGSQCSAWWVLSYPSRFNFVLACHLPLPAIFSS